MYMYIPNKEVLEARRDQTFQVLIVLAELQCCANAILPHHHETYGSPTMVRCVLHATAHVQSQLSDAAFDYL